MGRVIEVAPNLFVGTGADLIHVDDGNKGIKDGWHVITAAKEPWHREAIGYTGRGAPKDHPEYLIAHRKNRTILNLVDVADPFFIRDEIMDTAIGLIDMHLKAGDHVLVHCNQGHSRAPTIAMLWMAKHGPLKDKLPFEVIQEFQRIYPDYAPADGMRLYAERAIARSLEQA